MQKVLAAVVRATRALQRAGARCLRVSLQPPTDAARMPLPSTPAHPQWQELPPGHFIAGRSPKLQQFALTPAQLSIRESYERSMNEEMSPRALAMLASRARSLSPENGSGLFDDDPLFVY